MVEVTPSLLRTEFVGRSRELAALHECLRSALDRHPRVILCSGDSGIGKTRLAEELEASARAVDVPVVWGRAVDADGAPPSWMWRQTLRALCGIVDLRAVADEERLTIDLARLAPDLFGDAGEDDVDRAEKELERVTAQYVAVVDELLKHKEAELLEV